MNNSVDYIYKCPKCGWVRPEDSSARTCGRCGTILVKVAVVRKKLKSESKILYYRE